MLDERAKRRDEIDLEHSLAITLADGQEWYFPKPWYAISPIFRDGKAVDSFGFLTCGPELDTLVGLIASSSGRDAILATMTLGAFLLLRNYDLTDEELSGLFLYRVGEPASDEMVGNIIDVATGQNAPKASSDGSD